MIEIGDFRDSIASAVSSGIDVSNRFERMSHRTIALTANPSVNVQVNTEVLEIHDCAQNLTMHRG